MGGRVAETDTIHPVTRYYFKVKRFHGVTLTVNSTRMTTWCHHINLLTQHRPDKVY